MSHRIRFVASLVLTSTVALGCAATRATAPRADYTLVFLKTGPADKDVSGDERKSVFAGHMANINRLAERHDLVVAGPFGKMRHDPSLRGLFVLRTGDRAQAEQWAAGDPAVQRGVFVLEHHALATDAPLLLGLERALELEATAKTAATPTNPMDAMRSYVLLTAEHGDLARRELAPLVADGRVFALSTLDDDRAFAWLDAKDVADATTRFSDALDRIGAHTLDDWFGSIELSRLDTH